MSQGCLPCPQRTANLSLHQNKRLARPGVGGLPGRRSHIPQARLPFHLVNGSFQAAQADTELQPPQEVVGCGDQDVQLLIHEAIEGGSFSQMAPWRQKRVEKAQDAPQPPIPLPSISLPPQLPVILWSQPGTFQLLTCCVTLSRSLYLSGPQPGTSMRLGGPEDTAGKQMTFPLPRQV